MQIREINNFLTLHSFRVGYSAKENKYQLIDTKREYVVKRFDTLEQVEKIGKTNYLQFIQDYNKNGINTALEMYKSSIQGYIQRKFGLNCEVNANNNSIKITRGLKTYSINLENYSSMEDVKKAISGKIKKLA